MVVHVLLFVSIDFQNVSASWLLLFIAIKETMVVSGMHSEIRRLCQNKRFLTAK